MAAMAAMDAMAVVTVHPPHEMHRGDVHRATGTINVASVGSIIASSLAATRARAAPVTT